MKTFTITQQKEAFKAWEWIRHEVLQGRPIRLTIETDSEPVSQAKRVLLWVLLDRLSVKVVLESGLTLSARQWHQIAAQRVLGYDQIELDGKIYQAAVEPKNLSGEAFEKVAAEVIRLCQENGIDFEAIENERASNGLDDSPQSGGKNYAPRNVPHNRP